MPPPFLFAFFFGPNHFFGNKIITPDFTSRFSQAVYRRCIIRADIRHRVEEVLRRGQDLTEHFSKSGVQRVSGVEEAFEDARVGEGRVLGRTVGDAGTAAMVQRYIRSHRHEEHQDEQWKLFKAIGKPCPVGGDFFKIFSGERRLSKGTREVSYAVLAGSS